MRLLLPLILLLAAPLAAQGELTSAEKDALIRQLQADLARTQGDLALTQEQMQNVLRIVAELQAQMATGGAAAGDEYFIPQLAASSNALGHERRIGDNIYFGGYIDLEFFDPSGDGGDKFFDQHRLVPFMYADISDRVSAAAEIEIEHGSELEVEFAQLDYEINDAATVRTGIQLLPLGKLNEVHDSPIQDLTSRPLVDTYIIPTTLRDAGIGVHGNITEEISYAATVTNGFKGLMNDGTNEITPTKGLRNAAPHKESKVIGADPFDNINDDLAIAARVAVQPELGMEFGVSGLSDQYDEAGELDLFIGAIDATIDGKAVDWLPDNMELLGEAAFADLESSPLSKMAGVPESMNGFYVQTNAHFEPDFLDVLKEDGTVEQDAHFTFVTRYERTSIDEYEARRTTFGLNFRPNAQDTVYKLDLQLNGESGADGSNDDNAVVFSAASYF